VVNETTANAVLDLGGRELSIEPLAGQ
jgi:hypothetical protein